MKGKKGTKTRSRQTSQSVEREVPIVASIGDLSPAARVWVASELLPDLARAEVLQVAKNLGVKKPAAAASQFQLARYGRKMRQVAAALPPAEKSRIVTEGMRVHQASLATAAK